MSDYISRHVAIDSILDLSDFASVIELFEYVEDHDLQDSRLGGFIDAIDAVLLLPSVQSEQETGRWIKKGGMIYCSICASSFDTYFDDDFIYCPHCGASMMEELDDD